MSYNALIANLEDQKRLELEARDAIAVKIKELIGGLEELDRIISEKSADMVGAKLALSGEQTDYPALNEYLMGNEYLKGRKLEGALPALPQSL